MAIPSQAPRPNGWCEGVETRRAAPKGANAPTVKVKSRPQTSLALTRDGEAAKAVAGKKIPRFERTVPVRARPPAPRFALTGYAWRSHAKTARSEHVRHSLSEAK